MDSIIEGPGEVVVPVSLVETTELITSEKLVWAALTLYAGVKGRRRLSQMQLAAKLGYCRQTVAKAIDRLETLGWYTANPKLKLAKLSGKVIRVAAGLLLDTSIGAGARLMHMQLSVRLQVAEARRGAFRFKFTALSRELHKGVKSVRRAVEQLKQASWLILQQANRMAQISLAARNPVRELFDQMKARAIRRLERVDFKGEALMREALSLLVDSKDFEDDASPGFLVNPLTGEELQLDRFYWNHRVAFEFNGIQHYQATKLYSEETVKQQRIRDAIKRGICAKEKIPLVVLHPQDLSLGTLLQKVKGLLPLRNLLGGESLIRFLESACANYRRKSPEFTIY